MAVPVQTELQELERGRGRDADRPSEIPPAGWWDIGWRVWQEVGQDRVLLIAAGAAFMSGTRKPIELCHRNFSLPARGFQFLDELESLRL
jgi:hypothetical protein